MPARKIWDCLDTDELLNKADFSFLTTTVQRLVAIHDPPTLLFINPSCDTYFMGKKIRNMEKWKEQEN